MRNKTLTSLLIIALFLTTFMAAFKIPRALAASYNIPINFPTIAVALSSGLLLPGDQLHISPGYIEVLAAPLVIPIPSLWIIGSPPALGPTPMINVNGFSIIVAAPNVFIWGLNINDPTGTSAPILLLTPVSSNALIMNNIIQGVAPPNIGIVVTGTNNIVTLNTISFCGICIDVQGPSTGNIVKLNTINLPNIFGIQVSLGAGPNNGMYWNNVFATPEFWDLTPGSPPNFFDDTTLPGGPGFLKGNYWGITLPPPPPVPIPGPGTNGWFDNFPLPAAIAQLAGDINVDGRVNIKDIVLVAIHFTQVWCTNNWDPRADVNGDGIINILDIVRLAVNYGRTY